MTGGVRRVLGRIGEYGGTLATQILVLTILVFGYFWTADIYARFLAAERRASATQTANSFAGLLGAALNERIALVRGLAAFVETEVAGSDLAEDFPRFAEGLRRATVGVRNISAAPDFVVRHIHPVAGNERVLGNDLLHDSRPGFSETVQRAIASRDVTLHGPVALLQGGQGLIARQIAYRPDRPWGAVGIVFDLRAILDEVRFDAVPPEMGFAVRTESGTQVAGDGAVFRWDPIVERIPLPDGYWEFVLAPRAGWDALVRTDQNFQAFRIAFLVVAVLVEVLTLTILSQRRTLERLVTRRTDELNRAKREMEQFAYAAAHDLQEPLRAISSYAQLLERECKDRLDDEAREFIQQIVGGAGRLKMLLRDVQLFLAEDRVPLSNAPCDATAALDTALTILSRRIADTGAVVVAGELPTVLADERRLKEIFVILIGNAIEYRHPYRAADIRIGHRRLDGDDVIEVRDNGIGIEARYRDQIFEVFRRLHSRDEHPGTGMGLAIARKMVERLGGRITVDSSPGIGSTFAVHLPAHPARALP